MKLLLQERTSKVAALRRKVQLGPKGELEKLGKERRCCGQPGPIGHPLIRLDASRAPGLAVRETKNAWLTGAAAWNFVAISQHLLGVRPEHEGLRVQPCIGKELSAFTVTRHWG